MPRVVPSQVVELIDRLFPAAAGRGGQGPLNIGSMPQLAAIIHLVDQVPEELLVLDADRYSAYASSIAAIRIVITTWQLRGAVYPLDYLREFEDRSPVTILRNTLALCPDESPPAGTAELTFIPDRDLRESLRIDLSATNKALSNGEWKAATVLAGSVVEALLLWALEQRSADVPNAIDELARKGTPIPEAGKSLEFWHLPSYIEVAAELKVIKADTATLARLAKDFRNLIHPGRAARLGQVCNRGTALAAVAAVVHVVGDLTPP